MLCFSCLTLVSAQNQSFGSFPRTVGISTGDSHPHTTKKIITTLHRDSFTGDTEPLSKALPKMVADMNNAILGSNTFQEMYHTLEKDGDNGKVES